MDKIPKIEINCIPSQLNTSPPSGVASQLANIAQQQPHYDGITLDQMQGNPLYERIDDIDKVGLAKKVMIDNAKVVKSKRGLIRKVNEAAQRIGKK